MGSSWVRRLNVDSLNIGHKGNDRVQKLIPVLFFWLVVSFVSPSWALEEQNAFVLPDEAKDLSLTPYLWVWEDLSADMSFMEVQNAFQRGEFSGLGRSFAGYGFTESAYWFHIAIINPMEKARSLIMSMPTPLLDTLDVYCQLGQGRTYYYPLGEQTSFDRRRLKVRQYAIPLELPAASQTECYFRVHTTSYLMMKLSVSDAEAFLEQESNEQLKFGLFYGVGISFLFAILILYIVMREPVYLYYVVHLFGSLGFSSASDGTTSSLWSYLNAEDFVVVFFIACWMIGAILFAIELLQIKQRHTRLYRALLGAIVSMLMILVVYPWVSELQALKTIVHVATAYTFLLLGAGVYCAYRGDSRAVYFNVGWGFVSITVILTLLAMNGVLPDAGFITAGLKLGWAAEVIVLSLVSGINLKLMKRLQRDYQLGMETAQGENSEKSQFLAKMSHEVRTPMGGILGLAELMEATPLNRTQRRYLRAIQRSGKSMMDVVNGVLDVSKIEAGKATLKSQSIDVRALILDCLTIFEMGAKKNHIPLRAVIEVGTPLTVMGDSDRIQQVITNLLSNALKFTTRGSVSLVVSLTDQILDDHLVLKIEVKDSGIGISEEDQHRLFLPFSQIENSHSLNKEGTGLGLMICRQIVSLMNGEIGVDSESGKGSTFWFTVPFEVSDDCMLSEKEEFFELLDNRETLLHESRLDDEPLDNTSLDNTSLDNAPLDNTRSNSTRSDIASSNIASSNIASPSIITQIREFQPHEDQPQLHQVQSHSKVEERLRKSRILVVEDNEINRKVISGYLEQMGLVPDMANDGQEALDKFQNQEKEYDLVLMDCEMPVLDGFAATLALHQWQDSQGIKHTPVIALSAHVSDGHVQRSKDVGMLMHVSKPLSFKRFSSAITEALNTWVLSK